MHKLVLNIRDSIRQMMLGRHDDVRQKYSVIICAPILFDLPAGQS